MKPSAPTASMLAVSQVPSLVDAWRDLAANAAELNPFFSPELLIPALEAFAGTNVRLAVACNAEGGLIALAPVERARGYSRLPVRYLATWMHPHCFFGAPLIRRGDEREALATLFDLAAKDGAFFRLRHLDAGGQLYKIAQEVAAATGRLAAQSAPRERALLKAPFGTEAYLEQSLRGKKRKELRRLASRLAEEGEVGFEALADRAALPQWTADFLALEAAGWKGKERTALASMPQAKAFFQQALARSFDAGMLQFYRLTLSEKPIAMVVNFTEGGEAYSFKIAYDEAFARYSPGVMIEIEMMKALEKEPGFSFIDSCAAPDHPMINALWRGRRKIAALNVSGRDAAPKTLFRLLTGLERAGEGRRAKKGGAATAIFDDPAAALAQGYPSRPFRLRHRFAEDERFALPALLALARRLPPDSIEYNAGNIPIDQDPEKTPMTGLSIGETIRRIEDCNSWMALHHVERDADYAEAMEECLAEIAPCAAKSTGRMHKKIGFIFISSADAVTPLHFDPEHNILMQLQGSKRITLYPPGKVVGDERHELYHAGEAHRNLRHDPAFDAHAETFELHPGDALYVPVKAPHWVKNGPEPSVSFSVTWKSRASDAEARLRLANHRIRRWGGSPPPPGKAPARDAAVIAAQRIATKLSAPFRKA